MPDEQAVQRESGGGVFIARVASFFALIAFLVMCLVGMNWVNACLFHLPGWLSWAVAVSLLTANWIFVAVCALSIAGVVRRIPIEEQMMIKSFGDGYKAYLQRTGRFFPKFQEVQIDARKYIPFPGRRI